MKNIRNFSIIAHIDHGKTTLSDRLLERTGALTQREMTEQFLDSMDLEKERGITIKQHSVRLEYKAKDGQDYVLNLIDTPGHVDFSYEVSRSLAACQGVLLVHLADGRLAPGMKVRLMASGGTYEVEQLGVFTPKPLPVDSLSAGEVGFVIAGIKKVSDVAIGDTLTDDRRPAPEPLPGFKEIKPMVFAGLYPVDADMYAELRDALEKLRLNDSSFFYEPETSTALGFGFRCGFLGLLHMEIVQERLEREFTLELLVTAPSVRYRVLKTNGEILEIDSPARLPDPGSIDSIEEPIITAVILTPDEFVGPILKLCQEKRGVQKGLDYVTQTRVMITYELPLNEILLDFYDRLKSASKGYASLDYQLSGYWTSPLVKLDVLVNGDAVDALSLIVHRDSAYPRGKSLVEKMRKLIPRQMFEVAIQAAIGSRVIARETV